MEAIDLADALEGPELRSYALGARGVAAFERRHFHEAAQWSNQRLELIEVRERP